MKLFSCGAAALAAALTAGLLFTGAHAAQAQTPDGFGWCTLNHVHACHALCTLNHDHAADAYCRLYHDHAQDCLNGYCGRYTGATPASAGAAGSYGRNGCHSGGHHGGHHRR